MGEPTARQSAYGFIWPLEWEKKIIGLLDMRDENEIWSEIYWTLLHKHNYLLEVCDEAKRQQFFDKLSDEEEFFEASSSVPSASKSEGKY